VDQQPSKPYFWHSRKRSFAKAIALPLSYTRAGDRIAAFDGFVISVFLLDPVGYRA
jgi:hypothetical protein